jgi:hypothetical protein
MQRLRGKEAHPKVSRALIDRIESDDRYESLRPRAEILKTSQTELERAIEERENLRTPELRASVDLRTALDSGRRAYNRLYPKLTLLFESKGFLETFFITNDRSAKADPADPEDASAEPGEGLSAAV